jgi:signal transduction histidine kinase/ActR/RegA family two-component response regulator
MTFGLRSQVAIIAAAVLIAAIGALVATSGHYFGDALAKAQLSRAQSVAQGLAFQMERILSLGLDVRELKGFEQQCTEAVRANEGVDHAMVVSPGGEILFHSDPTRMHQAVVQGSLLQALTTGSGATEDRKLGLRYALVPTHDPSTEVRAFVVVAYPQSMIDGARNEMMRTTLAVGALVALAGLLLLSGALGHYVNRPLSEVVQAIDRFRTGEPADALRVPAAGGTELAIMVHGFNGLLDRIAARERELVSARDAAEAANRAKSEFLAMMSHELRTPMNGVLGMAELLGGTPLTERQQRYLTSIQSGSASLLRILDDILNFTRLEMGELTIQHAPFALRRLLEKTAALLQETAQAKRLTLDVDIGADIAASVVGDAGRTRQILVNLLGNALKFTNRGGVKLRVERMRGDRIRFSVSDTGIGIDPSFRKNLFSAFAQQDAGYARRYGGTGLGLALVKRLVDAMEGSIEMESTPGKGTTFRFELPLPEAYAPEAEQRAAVDPSVTSEASRQVERTEPAPNNHKKARVLVVEDNLLNQELALGYLEDTDYEVVIADDGRKGVEAFEREHFDVVLMDWQMPEMDGLEATRRIREIEAVRAMRRIPIIAVTAHAMASDREACLAAGMDDYLVKPYSLDALLQALKRWAPTS